MAAITQTCTSCGKQFLIIDKEQAFLKEKELPLPNQCPTCRQKRRLLLRGGERNLYKTVCAQCGKEVIVTYDPTKVTNTILCKKDYEDYFNTHDTLISEPLPEI